VNVASTLTKHFGARKIKKLFDDLLHALTKSEGPVPYSAVFTISSPFSVPSPFSISDFPGLLVCHVVKGTPHDRVMTYWLDEPHFRAYMDSFMRTIGVTNLSYTGAAVEIKLRKDPWWRFWRRISAKELVIAIFAFTGAVLGIRDYSAVLFAAPDVTLSYSGMERIDSVEGSQITVPVTVRSEVRFAPAFVKFTSAAILPRSGTREAKLLIDTSSLPSLVTGEFKSINLAVQAPAHDNDSKLPDIYDLEVTAETKAGILRWRKSISAKREFWVWPAQPSGPLPRVSHVAGPVCELTGIVYIAKPYPKGLAAQFALVAMGRTLPDMSVTADRDAASSERTFFTTSTRKIEFQTPPIEKFYPYPYRISLISAQPVTSIQCEGWSRGLKVSLNEPLGGS
jgi:hypothetical protein